MTTISKSEFKKEIISYFETNRKTTIAKAKEQIRKALKISEYNNSISVGNVRLFHTSNKNFCNGKANGYGAGWYITNAGKTYIRL